MYRKLYFKTERGLIYDGSGSSVNLKYFFSKSLHVPTIYF